MENAVVELVWVQQALPRVSLGLLAFLVSIKLLQFTGSPPPLYLRQPTTVFSSIRLPFAGCLIPSPFPAGLDTPSHPIVSDSIPSGCRRCAVFSCTFDALREMVACALGLARPGWKCCLGRAWKGSCQHFWPPCFLTLLPPPSLTLRLLPPSPPSSLPLLSYPPSCLVS